ncbi:ATP-binding protein, partial [Streptomyces sp. NPDC002285]
PYQREHHLLARPDTTDQTADSGMKQREKTTSEWGQVFGDDVLATAILDRLLHHCEVISINGPSYRLKNRLTAIEGGTTMA